MLDLYIPSQAVNDAFSSGVESITQKWNLTGTDKEVHFADDAVESGLRSFADDFVGLTHYTLSQCGAFYHDIRIDILRHILYGKEMPGFTFSPMGESLVCEEVVIRFFDSLYSDIRTQTQLGGKILLTEEAAVETRANKLVLVRKSGSSDFSQNKGFCPSERLCEICNEAIRKSAPDLGVQHCGLLSYATLIDHIREQTLGKIAMYGSAKQERGIVGEEVLVTREGEFIPWLREVVCERSHIQPEHPDPFLQLLARELQEHYEKNPIDPEWGDLFADKRGLIIRLKGGISDTERV